MSQTIDQQKNFLHSWDWCQEDRREIATFLKSKVLDPAQWKDCGTTIWKTRHKEVELYQLPEDKGDFRVAIKNYHERRFWRYCLRPSLAYREAKGFETVAQLGIPAAEVIACGEQRRGLRLTQAYFITRFEENTHCLIEFAPNQSLGNDHDKLMMLLIENIRHLATLHAAGFQHGGAHPRNFLWREEPGKAPYIIWIDLATVKKFSLTKKKQQILLDLTDLVEQFKLDQKDLDSLATAYTAIHPVPICFTPKDVNPIKFNICCWK